MTYAIVELEHHAGDPPNLKAVPLREEWRVVSTLVAPAFPEDGRGYSDVGNVSYGPEQSEAEARHNKAWREPLRGLIDGQRWPEVSMVLQHRLVSDWEQES